MYEQKTVPNAHPVKEFLDAIGHEKKRKDAYELLRICEEETGYPGVMWGPSIIGFGSYHYVYPTGHSGDAPLFGFSPRKASISLYSAVGDEQLKEILPGFGKYSMGKACIYVKKLEDINIDVLKEIIRHSVDFLTGMYEVSDK